MARYKSNFHLQRYLFIFATVLSVAALGVVVYASQQQTSTQSDAAGSGCVMKPRVKLASSKLADPNFIRGGDQPIQIYTFRILNDSEITCKKPLFWVSDHKIKPNGWVYVYTNHLVDGATFAWEGFNYLFPKQQQTLKIAIYPNYDIKKGTYKLPIKVCRTIPPGCSNNGYCGPRNNSLSVKYLENVNPDYCTKFNVDFVKK